MTGVMEMNLKETLTDVLDTTINLKYKLKERKKSEEFTKEYGRLHSDDVREIDIDVPSAEKLIDDAKKLIQQIPNLYDQWYSTNFNDKNCCLTDCKSTIKGSCDKDPCWKEKIRVPLLSVLHRFNQILHHLEKEVEKQRDKTNPELTDGAKHHQSVIEPLEIQEIANKILDTLDTILEGIRDLCKVCLRDGPARQSQDSGFGSLNEKKHMPMTVLHAIQIDTAEAPEDSTRMCELCVIERSGESSQSKRSNDPTQHDETARTSEDSGLGSLNEHKQLPETVFPAILSIYTPDGSTEDSIRLCESSNTGRSNDPTHHDETGECTRL